jgi:hypothetical protein
MPAERADLRDRLLVDLPRTRLGSGARGGAPGRGPLLRVLADELDAGTVRLTLELAEPVAYRVRSDGATVTITLGGADAPPPPPTIPRVEQPRP